MRFRMPSFPKMCARCPSTVRSERKSAAATSLFVLPSATSAATRSSAGVSAPGVAARPLMRLSSERARSAQSAAPIPSKIASASWSVSRASRRRFTRRCVAPSASRVRPRSSGSSTFACHSSASSTPRAQPPGRRPGRRAALGSARSSRAPRRARAAGVPLVPVEQLDGLVPPPELDQRLDRSVTKRDRSGLEDRLPPARRRRPAQARFRSAGVTERELEVAERGGCRQSRRSGCRVELESELCCRVARRVVPGAPRQGSGAPGCARQRAAAPTARQPETLDARPRVPARGSEKPRDLAESTRSQGRPFSSPSSLARRSSRRRSRLRVG